MSKCLDCGEELEFDPLDYEIGDFLYCEHCGASHNVTGVDDQEEGIKYSLVEDDK